MQREWEPTQSAEIIPRDKQGKNTCEPCALNMGRLHRPGEGGAIEGHGSGVQVAAYSKA